MLPLTIKKQLGIPRQVLIRSFTQISLSWMEHSTAMFLPFWIFFSVTLVSCSSYGVRCWLVLMKKDFLAPTVSMTFIIWSRASTRLACRDSISFPFTIHLALALALTRTFKHYCKQAWAETELQGFFLVVYLGISRKETLRSFFEDLDISER